MSIMHRIMRRAWRIGMHGRTDVRTNADACIRRIESADRNARARVRPPCPTHPHELASNCRLCAAERKGRPDQPNRPEGTEQ